MEQRLDRSSQMVMRLSAALDDYEESLDAIKELEVYYGSNEWKNDFADDEQGRLPQNLKRGVLSEDGIWNLQEDSRMLKERLASLLEKL